MNAQIDMSQFTQAKSDQLNAIDIAGGPMVIRITKVTANATSAEQPISVHYEGDGGKPFKPCLTMRRLMMEVWGKYAEQYVGKSMTLFRDPEVTFGKDATGGVRISHMSHMDKGRTFALPMAKGRFKQHKVQPLETGADASRSKAEAWAQDHIAAISSADSDAALTAILAKGQAARDKLASAHSDLADKVNVAISQARDSFDPLDGEGPSDAQRGEPLTLDTARGMIADAGTVAAVDAAMKAARAELSDADYEALLGVASDRIGEIG